jgi:hypothetical protein
MVLNIGETLIAVMLITTAVLAQQEDTLVYDAPSGNYIIHYKGVQTYARDSVGNERLLRVDDSVDDHEEVIEKDSIFIAVFEPATKLNPSVRCTTFGDTVPGGLIFSYEVINGKQSKQRLFTFIIEFSRDLSVRSRSTNGWFNRQDYEKGGGVLANRWSWFPAGKGLAPLLPGESFGDFALVSRALPGIGNAFLQGQTQRTPLPAHIKSEWLSARLFALRTFPANYLVIRTVVPMNIPGLFSPTNFLDTLLSYVHQSHELGWINNTRDDDCEADEKAEDGIVRNLDKRLTQTRDLVVKDKIGAAKNRLEKFLNKVEKLWNRQQKEEARNRKNPRIIFTSEAYALLKYNGEYLLDHLTETKEPKEDKKGKEK